MRPATSNVADTGNHRIQNFTGTATYLTQWGTLGGDSFLPAVAERYV